MDIYLTDLGTGECFRFPMVPERVNVRTGAIFQDYAILSIGEVKVPAGAELTGFQWEGVLPGKARENEFFVREWRDPHEIQSLWSVFRAQKKKLRLLATGTPINHDVYLERYGVEYAGGYGDYRYDVSFVQAKDLTVGLRAAPPGQAVPKERLDADAVPPAVPGRPRAGQWRKVSDDPAQGRPAPPSAKTYRVAPGDTLWSIAERFLGDGGRYPEILEANGWRYSESLAVPGNVVNIP